MEERKEETMADYNKKYSMGNNTDGCMDWDDAIENDGKEFIVLPEGDYVFKVTGFERGRYPGSTKIPPCNKATLTLEVRTKDGIAFAHTDIILYRSLEWKISSFFRSIGQKKHGERLVMDWNKVIGCRGRAHFHPETYTGKDGVEHQKNEVDRYLDYDETKMTEDPEDAFLQIPEDATDDLPFN